MFDWLNSLLARPSTPFALFAAVMMSVLTLLAFLVRSVVGMQKDLTATLSNHFQADSKNLEMIARHLATENEILRGLTDRILTSALRTPQEGLGLTSPKGQNETLDTSASSHLG